MEKLEVKQVAELEAKVLEELRYAFSQLHDVCDTNGTEGSGT